MIRLINPRRRSGLLGLAVMGALALAFFTLAAGCGEDADGGDGDSTPLVTAETFRINPDLPGRPLSEPEVDWAFAISKRMGFTLGINQINNLRATDDRPRKIIGGKQTITYTRFIKSRKLRIEDLLEPEGTRIIQVNVSLDGPIPLKSTRGYSRSEFIPGPVVGDNIGNFYYPIGYLLFNHSEGDDTKVININRGEQIRDLRKLPRLSRNRKQTLKLLFIVNRGVTISSFSYGGEDKVTLSLPIPL